MPIENNNSAESIEVDLDEETNSLPEVPQDSEESIEVDTEESEESDSDISDVEFEAVKHETAKQTVARVAKDLARLNEEKKQEQEPQQQQQQQQHRGHQPESLQAPSRFNAKQRDAFNRLQDPELKRALIDTARDLQSMTTREQQQLAQVREPAEAIYRAVQPYESAWKGQMETPQAIERLARSHSELMNPETRIGKFIEIGTSLGLDFAEIAEIAGEQQEAPQQQQYQSTQFSHLQEKINGLESRLEQSQVQELAKPITEQMRAVQSEVDPATGSSRYPELRDPAYLDMLAPRISELAGIAAETNEPFSYGDLLRQAAEERRESLGFASQRPLTRPSTAQNNYLPQRAVSAAVTTRGRSSASVGNGSQMIEPPPEALRNAKETMRWVNDRLAKGLPV